MQRGVLLILLLLLLLPGGLLGMAVGDESLLFGGNCTQAMIQLNDFIGLFRPGFSA